MIYFTFIINKYIEIQTNMDKKVYIEKKDLPKYVMHLLNGYCKQNTKAVFPLCLNNLVALYYFICKKQDLFCLKFQHPEIYNGFDEESKFVSIEETDFFGALSGIASNIALSNKCTKLMIKIDNDSLIEINMTESIPKIIVNGHPTTKKIQKKCDDETEWTMTRDDTKYFDIMFIINRQTPCKCPYSDGNIEFFISNLKEVPEIARGELKSIWWWKKESIAKVDDAELKEMLNKLQNPRIFGKMNRNENSNDYGYFTIKLKDGFEYESYQQVSIEVHGTDEMYVWSSKHANQAVDEYGFGRDCCLSNKFRERNML